MRYSDLGNGRFQNPVLFADYSDPDVIRAGDTYYMTASSFNYTPGLPILVSKDLVNWKLEGYALENIKEERYSIPRHSEGVWAPSIRFHEGRFYIYYGMPDEGIYVVRTENPLGKWEEPVLVLEGKGLIDPCPYWDEDGRAYIVHGYAKSRIGFKSILGIFEIDSEGLAAISEDHFIFDGNDPEHPAVTIEGPKVYKRNGYYYILAPAGGVREGYQAALRSKDIHGPYEIKEVMAQGSTVINGPHQGALVDTPEGREYFLHFQDRGLYGRICHLQPVSWRGDWPVIGKDRVDGCGEPVFELDKPSEGLPCQDDPSDSFPEGRYGLQWQWMGNHRQDFSGRTDEKKGLRLFSMNPSGDENPTLWRSANVLTQKLVYPQFEADILMDASNLSEGDRAGVCMTGGEYIAACICRENGSWFVRVYESEGPDSDKREHITAQLQGIIPDSTDLHFKLIFSCSGSSESGQLYYRNVTDPDGSCTPSLRILLNGRDLGISFTPKDHTWVGAKIGLFSLATKDSSGYADIKSVTVKEI